MIITRSKLWLMRGFPRSSWLRAATTPAIFFGFRMREFGLKHLDYTYQEGNENGGADFD
jgi:hypothetical protein